MRKSPRLQLPIVRDVVFHSHCRPWSRTDSEIGREGMHPTGMTAEAPQREDGQDTGPDWMSQGSAEEPAANQSRD